MKKILFTLALLLPLAAAAQSTTEGEVRASVGVDWKIKKGLHLNVEEELRTDGVFKSLGRLQTTVALEYKPVNWMKLGLGYSLINPYDGTSRQFKDTRHRVFFDAGAHYTVNGFSFSIKERLQMTHRTGSYNVYQTTPYALGLKSRIGVEYKNWTYFEPGVFLELRTAFNDPWGEVSGSLQYKDDGTTFYSYTPMGYTHVYNNRLRTIFRTDIKLSSHHVLKPYALVDYVMDYDIDTNSEGTRLFKAEYNDHFKVTVGLSYTFKF